MAVVMLSSGAALADRPKLVDAKCHGELVSVPDGWKVRDLPGSDSMIEASLKRGTYVTAMTVRFEGDDNHYTNDTLIEHFVTGDGQHAKGKVVERRSLGKGGVLVVIDYGDKPTMRAALAVRIADHKMTTVDWTATVEDFQSFGGSKLVEDIFKSFRAP